MKRSSVWLIVMALLLAPGFVFGAAKTKIETKTTRQQVEKNVENGRKQTDQEAKKKQKELEKKKNRAKKESAKKQKELERKKKQAEKEAKMKQKR